MCREACYGFSEDSMKQAIVSKLDSYPDGAYGIIHGRQTATGIGHYFNFEKVNGKINFIDCQDVNRDAEANMWNLFDITSLKVARTDNLELSDNAANYVKAVAIND